MQPDLTSSFKVDELQLRYRRRAFTSPARVATSQDAFQLLQPLIGDRPREVLVSVALSSYNAVIGLEYVSAGANNQATVVPGEVFKALLLTNATAFILAHNHPSGNTEPSDQDRQVAAMINAAAEILGIKMLDFIVVTRDNHYSFEDRYPEWRRHSFNPGPP